ncbi:hypothetical protein, partial [Maribacter flavus]|uniref:hypothetical protein n=1 Tax=Maribacter flavus TaxID=1658664 RepID=UPI003D3284F9
MKLALELVSSINKRLMAKKGIYQYKNTYNIRENGNFHFLEMFPGFGCRGFPKTFSFLVWFIFLKIAFFGGRTEKMHSLYGF